MRTTRALLVKCPDGISGFQSSFLITMSAQLSRYSYETVMQSHSFQVCELIEALLPDDIRPVCDSVVAHIFISCIYGIINKLVPIFR